VEVLADRIRTDRNIPGICVGNAEIKISQLADDTTLFLCDVNALEASLELIEEFRICSGLKLNKMKTEIVYLGNTNHRPNTHGIKVVKTDFQALGIHFSSNINEPQF
jgi:hypothetical protein